MYQIFNHQNQYLTTGNNNILISFGFHISTDMLCMLLNCERIWVLESLVRCVKHTKRASSVTLVQSSVKWTSRMRPHVFSNVNVRPRTSICRTPSTVSRHNMHHWHWSQTVWKHDINLAIMLAIYSVQKTKIDTANVYIQIYARIANSIVNMVTYQQWLGWPDLHKCDPSHT